MTGQPIVVGVDGTRAGERALRWALDEAVLRDCPLHVVNVWQYEPLADWTMDSEERALARSQAVVDEALKAVSAGRDEFPRAFRFCLRGSAAEVLEAHARGAALLVLGAHSGMRLRKKILGSTSTHCVLHATAPVVVVPAEVPAQEEAAGEAVEGAVR